MTRIVLTILLTAALLVGGWFLFSHFQTPRDGGSDSGEISPNRELACDRPINALGYLLPRDGLISVNAAPGDQLAVLKVKEADVVSEGQLLAELTSQPLRLLESKARASQAREAAEQWKGELAAAEKRVAAAKVAQEKIALQKIEEAAQQAQIDFLKTNLKLVKRSLERLGGVSESLVSVQKREQQELLVEKATAELRAAERKLEGMIASRQHAEKAAQAELAVAEAGLDLVEAADKTASLQTAVEIANFRYEQTFIKAPAAGTVLKTFLKPGESLGPKPILQMANLDQMICEAEVFETDIQCVHVGQSVLVTSPAFPKATGQTAGIPGIVKRINRLVSPPELQSLDPYAANDRHVVGVQIEFGKEASRTVSHFVNLQVEVEFLVQPSQ